MFDNLTKSFQNVFSKLSREKKLTEENISEAIRHVRLALLEADVNYKVVKNFIKDVKEKALGEKITKSVSPQDQFIKIVHDALKELMGSKEVKLTDSFRPSILMLVGLQGSGKTTQAAKLALMLKKQHKKVLLVACDLQRLAAIEQLETLGQQIGVEVFVDKEGKKPLKVAKKGVEKGKKEGFDVVIIDTAGRLHLDEELMQQLEKLKKEIKPHDVLFVANAATGQDAPNVAARFNERVEIRGTILTMLDGNTRAGAAISIREVTGKPLLFEGIGEKVTDFRVFNPHSMADRVLGMGDVINLVKKAEEHFSEKESKKIEKKILKATFTYEDFLKQMRSMKKMGSFKGLLQMLPGFSNFEGLDVSDKEMGKIEAMILSMTQNERLGFDELLPSRRRRIARGSGTKIEDVNRLIKQFKRLKKMVKNMPLFNKKFKQEKDLKKHLGSLADLKKGFSKFS